MTGAGAQWLALSSTPFARACPLKMYVRERVTVMRERVRSVRERVRCASVSDLMCQWVPWVWRSGLGLSPEVPASIHLARGFSIGYGDLPHEEVRYSSSHLDPAQCGH